MKLFSNFWNRLGRKRRTGQGQLHRAWRQRQSHLHLEQLEKREVLIGTWTLLANTATGNLGTMLLLSDGTVMAQQAGISSTWYQLTPQAFTGNYINGTWSPRASMNLPRLYYASNVLPSGNVFVEGGEYTDPQNPQTQTLTNTGEIYNPVANTWTNIANFPLSQFGDDPSAMLPDGRVLTGFINGSQTYIYNPTTNTWTFAASKLRGDASDEESWVKLPDNSILSYDVFASGTTTGSAQRYVPAQNQWVDTGTVPVALQSATGSEIGPAFLLPDGRVFQLGGNGNTAYYTPSTDTWARGPSIPGGLVADDDPGAVLPNGNILFAADTSFETAPTRIFEFNPNTNTYTDVTPAGYNLNVPAYITRMLVLPTGQVLLSNGSNQIDVYTPDGAPNAAWLPAITDVTRNSDSTVTLTGTQLNGLSEGAAYGDDAEMSSNYPLVRLLNAPFLGTVYLRTSNWSSTGVATGSLPETVQFSLGTGFDILMNAVANGIASPAVLCVEMSSSVNNVRLRRDPGNPANLQILNNGAFFDSVPFSSFSRVIVTGANGSSNTLTVDYTVGGGFDTPITFDGGNGVGGGNALIVTDAGDSRSSTWTVTGSSIVDATVGGFTGSIKYSRLQGVELDGGSGGSTVNVLGNSAQLDVVSAGPTAVNVGNAGRLTDVLAAIIIANPPSLSVVNVDDSNDPGVRTVTQDTFFFRNANYGRISFGGVPILYKYADTSAMTLRTGTDVNTINVPATGVTTNLIAGTGSFTQITVGSPTAGLDAVNGAVSVSGPIFSLLIDDAHASANHGSTLGRNAFQRADKGPINYQGVQSLTVNASLNTSPASTITVQDTPPIGGFTTINNVGGFDNVVIQRTTGSLLIYASGNSFIAVRNNLSNIQGAITIEPAGSSVSLSLEDTASTTPRQLDVTKTMFGTTFQASGAASIGTQFGQVGSFQWLGGSGGNTLHVHGKPASGSSNFVLGAGNDSLFLSSDPVLNKISNLGSIIVSSGGGSDSVFLNDSDETSTQSYTVSTDINGHETFSIGGLSTLLTLGTDGRPVPAIILTGSSSGNNTLRGPFATTTWALTGRNAGSLTFGPGTTTFTGVQNLIGSASPNTFVFSDGAGVDGNLDGGSTGALDFAAYTTGVTVDLTANTATGVGGTVQNIRQLRGGQSGDNLTGNAAGTTTFLASPGNDTITGAGGTNTLIGTNADTIWNLTGSNAGTLAFTGGTTTFSGVQNLTGGTGADQFVFGDGAGVGGIINGGGGTNTLDYTAYTTPVTVNVGTSSAPGMGGSFQNVQSFVGSAGGGNTLVGRILVLNTWNVTGTNAGSLSFLGNTTTFSGFQNLTGGNFNSTDTFIFSGGAGVDGTIIGSGNGFSNTLNYAAYTTPVNINLSSNSATGVGGGFRNVGNFVGSGGGGNTLVGPDAGAVWDVTGTNRGALPGFSFTGFQNLTGGAGNDTFRFAPGAGVDGTIDGGGGTNSLSYFSYTGNVLVNLQTGTATGVGGGGANIQNVQGNAFGAAGAFYNILVGNGGNILTGGSGQRNLLIAGGSASTLIGGSDNDILIGGTTDYDTNQAALLDIMSVWMSADTYANRAARLVDDPSYAFSLNAGTVHSNGGGNTLRGKAIFNTPDLYFANLGAGDITDATMADRLVAIS